MSLEFEFMPNPPSAHFYCPETGMCYGSCCNPCPTLVEATGGYTPSQIAAGLPGQCPQGPGGAEGFPSGVTGPGLSVAKCKVQSSAGDLILGTFGAIGTDVQNAATAAKDAVVNAVGKLPSLTTVILALLVIGLLFTFVYGYAKGR